MRPMEEQDYWNRAMNWIPKVAKCVVCGNKFVPGVVDSKNFDEKYDIMTVYWAAELNGSITKPNPKGFCSVFCYCGWQEANPEKMVMALALLMGVEENAKDR